MFSVCYDRSESPSCAVPFLIKQEFKIIFSLLTLKIMTLMCSLPLPHPRVCLIENK